MCVCVNSIVIHVHVCVCTNHSSLLTYTEYIIISQAVCCIERDWRGPDITVSVVGAVEVILAQLVTKPTVESHRELSSVSL